MHLPAQVTRFGSIALLACALTACQSSTSSTNPDSTSSAGPASTAVVPKMGVVTQEIAGHPRLFSTFGFWMMDATLKSQLLACYRTDGTLNRALLRQTLPEAKIVEGSDIVAVALPSGTFTFFLLRDGPLISLDPKFDSMVQQMSEKAYTTP